MNKELKVGQKVYFVDGLIEADAWEDDGSTIGRGIIERIPEVHDPYIQIRSLDKNYKNKYSIFNVRGAKIFTSKEELATRIEEIKLDLDTQLMMIGELK